MFQVGIIYSQIMATVTIYNKLPVELTKKREKKMNKPYSFLTQISRYLTLSTCLLSLTLSVALSANTHAALQESASSESIKVSIIVSPLTVKWADYQSFTDVKPATGSRRAFAESTFHNIEKYLQKLAVDLPEGHTLVININNLDLAGRVLPGSFTGLGLHSADMIRVIKSIDIPRIEFTYEYTDANGNVLKSDSVNLKDMSFMTGQNPLFSSDSLKYEKNMLRKWFKKTFALEMLG